MHSADPGTHLSQRCQERLHLLRIPHDHRKRYRPNFLYSAASSWFRAPFCTPAPHGRPPGLRKPLQKIATPGASPVAPNNSFSIPPPDVPLFLQEIRHGQTRSWFRPPAPRAEISQSSNLPDPSLPLAMLGQFARSAQALFVFTIRSPPRSTLFPYTTLSS